MLSGARKVFDLVRDRPAWRLAFGAMMLGFAPILVRTAESPPTTSAFYRMLLGGLMLMTFQLVTRRSVTMKLRVFFGLMAAGMAFAFDLFFWHRSIQLIGPGLATLLSGFQVFILAIVGITFLGERLRWQLVVAIPAAFVGVAMIIGVEWSSLGEAYRKGLLFGLATAICYSGYLLTMRWARYNAAVKSSPMSEVAWMSLVCALALALLSTATGESLAIGSSRELLVLVSYALLAQLGLVVISSSLNKVPTSLVGLLLLLEPTFAYIWDLILFTRSVSVGEIVGVCVAITAIYLGSQDPAK